MKINFCEQIVVKLCSLWKSTLYLLLKEGSEVAGTSIQEQMQIPLISSTTWQHNPAMDAFLKFTDMACSLCSRCNRAVWRPVNS
eukprot:6478779-Amphidinium_carterae.1